MEMESETDCLGSRDSDYAAAIRNCEILGCLGVAEADLLRAALRKFLNVLTSKIN